MKPSFAEAATAPAVETMRICAQALHAVHAAARAVHWRECLGLLAGAPGNETVTMAWPLVAEGLVGHAEASPLTIRLALSALAARGLVPRGIYHSHGLSHVFESSTDIATLARLAPSFAAHLYRRPAAAEHAPVVCGPARAILPSPDGQTLAFELDGAGIPGLAASELAEWTAVRVGFDPGRQTPVATVRTDGLELAGSGVVISIGLPISASLRCRRLDNAPFRTATVYSLIVNARGDQAAVALVVHDLDGRAVSEPGRACAIEQVCESSGMAASCDDGARHGLPQATNGWERHR